MTQKKALEDESKISTWTVFKSYLKTSRKRITFMLIIGSIFFLIITSIIFISFSIYQDKFYDYIDSDIDWNNDSMISVDTSSSIHISENLESNYLMKGITEITTKLESIIPDIQNGYTGRLEAKVYNFVSEDEKYRILLNTFDDLALDLIENNLDSGRMPENETEVIYYNVLNESLYEINDVLNLTGYFNSNAEFTTKKCQIVGIIEDLDNTFFANNLSIDILDNFYYNFITSSNYYYDLINNLDRVSISFSVKIDYIYQLSVKHLKTNKYINKLNSFVEFKDKSFIIMPNSNYYKLFNDLILVFSRFKMDSYLSSFKQLLIFLPLILFTSFTSIEIYRTGNFNKRSKMRIMKTQGISGKLISKIIIYENILIMSFSLLIGTIFSLIIDFGIVQSLNLAPKVSFIASFWNQSSFIKIIVLFIMFMSINIILDLSQLRRIKTTVTKELKIKKKKFLSKIFSIPELNFFIPGIILTIFGLILSFLSFNGDYEELTFVIYFFIGFSIMSVVGIIFLLFTALLFIRRVMLFLWSRIGSKIWDNTKSYFTLAMKHLAVYNRSYKNTIMVFFLIGLCLLPGLIVNSAIDQHIPFEANLSIGCSDILVKDWELTSNMKTNVSNIAGVNACTVLSDISMGIEDTSSVEESFYSVHFYVIDNPAEFIDVVDFELLTKDGYSKDDILQLENELSYMMNREYARKNNYHKNEVFTTALLSSVVYQQKALTYVNDFSYFPLKEQTRLDATTIEDLFNQPISIDLVVSNQTKELILENSQRDRSRKDYLLISTIDGVNKTAIKDELTTNYGLSAYSLEDALTSFDEELNTSGLKFYVLISILSTILAAIYGGFFAINSFNERQRLLESIIRSGARSWHIVGLFSLELLLVVIVPILISIAITIPYLNNLTSFLLNVPTTFMELQIWFPWWIFILACLIILFGLFIGWLSILYPSIKKYKLTKQE